MVNYEHISPTLQTFILYLSSIYLLSYIANIIKDYSHQRRTAYHNHQNKHAHLNHMIFVFIIEFDWCAQDSLHAESEIARKSPDDSHIVEAAGNETKKEYEDIINLAAVWLSTLTPITCHLEDFVSHKNTQY